MHLAIAVLPKSREILQEEIGTALFFLNGQSSSGDELLAMAVGGALLSSEHDPWKVAALVSAFTQLLLAIIFLLEIVIACLTVKFIRYFGLGPPCWYAGCVHRHHFTVPRPQGGYVAYSSHENGFCRSGDCRLTPEARSNSGLGTRKIYRATDACKDGAELSTDLEDPETHSLSSEGEIRRLRRHYYVEDDVMCESSFTESGTSDRRRMERSRSQEWCDRDSTYLVCPNCNSAWTVRRRPAYRDATEIFRGGGGSYQSDDGISHTYQGEGTALSTQGSSVTRGNVDRIHRSEKAKEEKKKEILVRDLPERVHRYQDCIEERAEAVGEEISNEGEAQTNSNGKRGEASLQESVQKETMSVIHELPQDGGKMQEPGKESQQMNIEDLPQESQHIRIEEAGRNVALIALLDGAQPRIGEEREASAPVLRVDDAGIERQTLVSDIQEKLVGTHREEDQHEKSIQVFRMDGFGQDLTEETKQRKGMIETQVDVAVQGQLEGTQQEGSEDAVVRLSEALQMERNTLSALYEELEEERNAAEIAANEAMAMISRLQEEKAALKMEAAHYRRMAEEKAIYDEQAMLLLKEILYKREKDNFVLEKEVKLFKKRFLKDKLDKMSKTKKVRENGFMSIESSEPVLLLKGVEDACFSEREQTMRSAEADSHSPDQEWKFPNGDGFSESFVAKSSPIHSSVEEQPSKRLRGLPLDKDDVKQGTMMSSDIPDPTCQPYRPQSDGALVGSRLRIHSKLGDAGESEQGPHDLFPQGHHEEQPREKLEMSDLATDDEETHSILERLWALEEQLQALRETEELEPGQDAYNHISSDARNLESSGFLGQLSGDSYSDGFVTSCFPETVGTVVMESEEDSVFRRDAFWKATSMVDSYGSNNTDLDDAGNIEMKAASSYSQPRGEAQISPVHDIYEVQHGSKQSRKYSEWEAHEMPWDMENRLGKPDLLPGNVSEEGLTSVVLDRTQCATSGMSVEFNCFHGVPSSGPNNEVDQNVTSSDDTQYPIDEFSSDVPSEDNGSKSVASSDNKWTMTEKEAHKLTTRLHVLETDRELLRHTLASLNYKDNIDVLQEIVQQLQEESPKANRNTAEPDETTQSVESHFMSSSKTYNRTIRKRQFWNGPGQT